MSGNQLHGKHALGARANKISQGILTVRFEMPYPIWCSTCPKPTVIGQGVRFNAEKKKVGNYFSSPIYSFRMKHTACGGWIEIRTDPKNTAYVVTEGAKKRDLGDEKEGDMKILTSEEREELRSNAMASLEGTNADKARLKESEERIAGLKDLSSQHWDDPHTQNRKLRKIFREGRHAREKEAAATGLLQDKMSLGLDILPETEGDRLRAKLIEYGEQDHERSIAKVVSKPLFPSTVKPLPLKASGTKLSKRQKAEDLAKRNTANAVAEIRDNTRAAIDPFLLNAPKSTPKPLLLGIKRKRPSPEEPSESRPKATLLVDYDSD